MRKYPILLLALALLLGVSAVFAACAMDAPKDQVAFTERVVYGDPAAADGLTVAFHEQYRNYLHWASTLSFTESSYTAHTDYTFEHDRYWNNDSGVVRSLDIWNGIMASYDFDQDNALAAAVNALEDKVQPGTTASALLRVADYYETYPLDVNIVLPDMFYGMQPTYQLGPEQDAMTRIQDYFQIPVLDDQYLEVEVGKSVNGGSSVGMSSTEQGDSFDFYTQSVATDDAFYFFFSNRTQLGNLVDTSRIPSGYGVYRLPYGWVDTDNPIKGRRTAGTTTMSLPISSSVSTRLTRRSRFPISRPAATGRACSSTRLRVTTMSFTCSMRPAARSCSASSSGRLARMTGGSVRTDRISSSSASRTNSSSTR